MTERIHVDLGERGYDIVVGRDLLADLQQHAAIPQGARRAALVTQEPVARHHATAVTAALEAAGLDVVRCEVPDGETAKDVAILDRLWKRLAEVPFTRSDVVVGLGGGVVGDLAGFLAATWNRGIPVIHVPTTLLAQVDAAIGGKTAVNLPHGKNLVGAFHQPQAVVADVSTLSTLGTRERTSGLGEVVKYGFSHDPVILDLLEADPVAARTGDVDLMEELVTRSARVKAGVVASDERESGERAFLNLGHTYGHAVESLTGYTDVRHGEAVGIGLLVALRIGIATGATAPDLLTRATDLLSAVGLPTTAPVLDRAEVWATMARDKKATDGVRFVLLRGLAAPYLDTPDRAAVDAAIDAVESR